MQATITRGGGFTGLEEQLGPLDTATLAGDLGGRIEAKVDEIAFFELPAETPGGQRAGETVWHRIAIVDGDRSHRVSFDNQSDPQKAAPLDELRTLIEASGLEYHEVPRGEAA
jgi:Emfourin